MAKVILEPIGEAHEQSFRDEVWQAQREQMERHNQELQLKRDWVRDGWGEKYRDRVRAKGKLTTWDRIDSLKDEDSPVLPIGTLVNYGRTFGPDERTSPGAGVVTAFARVHGLAGGAQGPGDRGEAKSRGPAA